MDAQQDDDCGPQVLRRVPPFSGGSRLFFFSIKNLTVLFFLIKKTLEKFVQSRQRVFIKSVINLINFIASTSMFRIKCIHLLSLCIVLLLL